MRLSQTRRRGTELENAILAASWTTLLESGYQDLTFEAVAQAAQTGKAAIYRRWKTKEDLILATLHFQNERDRLLIAETGSLRGDVLSLLRNMNRRYTKILPALFSVLLASYFSQSQLTPAQVREYVLGDRPVLMDAIIERALGRGEIHRLPPRRVIELPYALLRHEFLMNLAPTSDDVVVEMVDTIFMPIISSY